MNAHIYIATDSAYAGQRERQYGYVLECEYHGSIQTREGFGEMRGTYNQVILTAMAEAMERFKRRCEIYVHTENTYILEMTARNLAKWESESFQTSSGKALKNQNEWIRLWKAIKNQSVIGVPGKHEYSEWLKSEFDHRKTRQHQ